MAEPLRKPVRRDARDRVAHAAGREGDDDFHRLLRPGLRPGSDGKEQRQNQSFHFILSAIQRAHASVRASSPIRPMTWMPSGIPLGLVAAGTATAGVCSRVHTTFIATSPVEAMPCGASLV